MNRSALLSLLLLFSLLSQAQDQESADRNQKLIDESIRYWAEVKCGGLFAAVKQRTAYAVKKNLEGLKALSISASDCVDENGWTALHLLVKTKNKSDPSYYEIFTLLRYHGNMRLDQKTD